MATTLKQFSLFAGFNYYPLGGWSDFQDSFDTLEEARQAEKKLGYEWYQIVDKETGGVVEDG